MKKQVKRLLPIILAASVATAANADGAFEGFYLGAGIGTSINTGTLNGAVSDTITTPAGGSIRETFGFNGHIGGKANFAGTLFAGYGCPVWDPIYIGAEVFVIGGGKHKRGVRAFDTYQNLTTGFSDTDAVSIRPNHRSWQWGIDFRPGIMFCPESMLYFRIGAGWNRSGTRFAYANVTTPASTGVPGVLVARETSRHKNRTSLRLGVGLEQSICDCWTIRADYVYTTNRRHRGNALFNATTRDGNTHRIVDSFSSKLHNHTAMLGVSYYFN